MRTAWQIDSRAAAVYARLFHTLLDAGVALAPSAYEIGFLSLAHTRSDVERLGETLQRALADPEISRSLA